MLKKEYFRYPKIIEGLEVTKAELKELSEEFSYVSVSEADRNDIEKLNDDEIVGAIFGDIDNILQDRGMEVENEVTANPDCWFVNNSFIEKSYKDLDRQDFKFGEVIELLKLGYKVARKGWNGKNLFIFLVPGSTFKVNRPPLLGIYPEGTEINYHSHIDMKTANGEIVPWLASQSDMLSEDWIVVE